MSQSDAAKDAAGQTAGTAKDEAAGVAAKASSAASDVAGTAKEQAAAATGDAMGEAREVFDQTKGQVEEQAGVLAHKLGESLKVLAGELRELGEGRSDGSGQAAGLAKSAAKRGEDISELLTRQGPSGVLSELRGYAGRNPGTFLLGALVAGVAAGRLTRGVRDDADTGSSTGSSTGAVPARPATPRSVTPGRVQPATVAPTSVDPRSPLEPGYETAGQDSLRRVSPDAGVAGGSLSDPSRPGTGPL